MLEHLKTSRNKYINEAVDYYNNYHKRKLLEERIVKESILVSENSMNILGEFEKFEDEIRTI